MKNALTKLVNAARTAKEADDTLRKIGYTDTPYFDIYGDILDFIYAFLDEKTDCLEESVTYTILSNTDLTNAQCAEMIEAEYKKTHIDIAVPQATMTGLREATHMGNDIESLAKVILSEWVMNRERMKVAM